MVVLNIDCFLYSLSVSDATGAVKLAYRVLLNEMGYPPEARQGACQRVCLPLLRATGEETLREFYLSVVHEVMTIVEAPLSRVSLIALYIHCIHAQLHQKCEEKKNF